MKPQTELLIIDGLEVQVTRKKIKNSYLRICHQTGLIRLSIPHSLRQNQVDNFIRSKRTWIDKHVEQINQKPQLPTYHYLSGEFHPYQGELYQLKLISSNLTNSVKIDYENKLLVMKIKGELNIENKKRLLTEWYRAQFKQQLPVLIQKWEQVIGVESQDWGVRQMRTRWGTCNTQSKKIWLNLELIKKPIICLEYVLVHELVHLLERKHNKVFYAYMSEYMPDWKDYDQLLKNA